MSYLNNIFCYQDSDGKRNVLKMDINGGPPICFTNSLIPQNNPNLILLIRFDKSLRAFIKPLKSRLSSTQSVLHNRDLNSGIRYVNVGGLLHLISPFLAISFGRHYSTLPLRKSDICGWKCRLLREGKQFFIRVFKFWNYLYLGLSVIM